MECERPYLFTGPLVLAILDGRKTETRRVLMGPGVEAIVDQPGDRWERYATSNLANRRDRGRWLLIRDDAVAFESRPYSLVGDGLWVKETWRVDEGWDITPPRDLPARLARRDDHIYYEATKGTMRQGLHPGRIRQSIFMPRWASRITRKVVAMRVERLQAITEEGARAEGLPRPIGPLEGIHEYPPGTTAIRQFRELWAGINGKSPAKRWKADPLVVVTTFEGP